MEAAAQDREKRLGTEPVGRLLAGMAIPAVAAQLVNVLYNMVDRMYIGRMPEVGVQALTGVGVCMPVILMVSAFAALASMGGAPRASILLGQGDKEGAEKVLGNCAAVLVLLAAVLTALIFVLGKPVLLLFGASGNTVGYAWEYLSVYAAGTLFVQLSLGLNFFITAQGFAKTSMLTVVIGAVANIILDPIFIFALDMGVRGAALATIVSQAISAVWVVAFLTGKRALLRLRPVNLRPRRRVLLPCLALGLSPFIMQITESILVVCFNSSLQRHGGDLAVGAMTILSTVRQFALLPMSGLTQGAQPIISYNFGAGKAQRVRRTFRLTITISLVYVFALWAACMFAPRVFTVLFTREPELTETTVWAMRIYMCVVFTNGVQNTCQATFIALGNARTSIFLALFRKMFLLIPLIYILPLFFADKVFAVYLAEPVADFVAAATTGALFAIQFRRAMEGLPRGRQGDEQQA